jgi:hypothetical protein
MKTVKMCIANKERWGVFDGEDMAEIRRGIYKFKKMKKSRALFIANWYNISKCFFVANIIDFI